MVVLLLIILIIVIVGVFVAFIGSSRQTKQTTVQEEFPSLSFDSQAIYRPIRSLKRQIVEITESSNDAAIHAMGGSVRQEVQDSHDRVVSALQTRDRLRKVIEEHANVEGEAVRLMELRDSAASPAEKLNYTKAYEMKSGELEEFRKAKDYIKRIEDEVELTKTSMSELKAKLSMSSAAETATARAEDLRATLGSLETIQTSVEEAQKLFNS